MVTEAQVLELCEKYNYKLIVSMTHLEVTGFKVPM